MDEILNVSALSKEFSLEAGFFQKNRNTVYAVNDVSFSVGRGETYGILGESGCGKTTTARLIIKMYEATGGSITFFDRKENMKSEKAGLEDSGFHSEPLDVCSLKGKRLESYREKVKYIFQDPARSLNPRLTVFDVMTSGLRYSSQWKGKKDAFEKASEIIREAGLSEEDLFRRPPEFSGGQRQRISIARGLIMNPSLLICDEVVSALDVSIQGQIINLLSELKEKRNLSYIFITHDLKVASYFCDRIGVMYRGILVEEGNASDLYRTALHPYTRLLFEGSEYKRTKSSVEVKTTLEKESACPFSYRCPFADEKCKESLPEFREVSEGRKVRCFKV